MSHRLAARLYGVFFILTFLSYGIGSGLIDSVVSSPNALTHIASQVNTLVLGAVLMAICHTILNIGLPVLLLPILKPHSKELTLGYIALACVATTVLVFGVIALLMLIPLSEAYVSDGTTTATTFNTIFNMLKSAGANAYQIGMALWGVGGILMCAVLYKARLVPRIFSVWGFIGYFIFITGTLLELYGYPYGVMLSMPGGLFEIGLSLWLIIKGFHVQAIKHSATV